MLFDDCEELSTETEETREAEASYVAGFPVPLPLPPGPRPAATPAGGATRATAAATYFAAAAAVLLLLGRLARRRARGRPAARRVGAAEWLFV